MNFSTRLRTKYANSKEISFVQLLDIFQLLGGVSQYEIRLEFSYFIPLYKVWSYYEKRSCIA